MWPFTKRNEPAPLPPQVISDEMRRAERLARYRSKLTIRVCNTGEFAAIGMGCVTWGKTADEAVELHRFRTARLYNPDPRGLREPPLRPRLIWASDAQRWVAIKGMHSAESVHPLVAMVRLFEKMRGRND